MKNGILFLLSCLPLFLSCAERREEPKEVARPQATVNNAPRDTRSRVSLIAEEKAIRLAKAAAIRQKGSLEEYEIVATESGDGWLVAIQWKRNYFGARTGGTTEYFIDKEGEKIIEVRIHQ